MGIQALPKEETLWYKAMIPFWDELREKLGYQRTLPGKEESTLIEVKLADYARQFGVSMATLRRARETLQAEGYLVLEAAGRHNSPTVLRLFTTDPYGEADVKPLPEGYFVPKKAKRGRSIMKRYRKHIPEAPDLAPVGHPSANGEVLEAEADVEIPEFSFPEIKVRVPYQKALVVAGLLDLIRDGVRTEEAIAEFKAEAVEAREARDEAEDQTADLANKLASLRVEFNERGKRLDQVIEEKEYYAVVAGAAQRSIRTAKSIVAEALKVFRSLASDSWSVKPSRANIKLLIENFGAAAEVLDSKIARLEEVVLLSEG